MTKTKGALPFEHYLEVEWEDAVSNDGWADKDTDLSPEIIISRGWLVKSTAKYITIANSIHRDSDYQFGGTQTITRVMITKCREITIGTRNVQRASKKTLHKKGKGEINSGGEISESTLGINESKSITE